MKGYVIFLAVFILLGCEEHDSLCETDPITEKGDEPEAIESGFSDDFQTEKLTVVEIENPDTERFAAGITLEEAAEIGAR